MADMRDFQSRMGGASMGRSARLRGGAAAGSVKGSQSSSGRNSQNNSEMGKAWSASVENSIFGLFYLLADGKRDSAPNRKLQALLLLADIYSVATLLVNESQGWPIDSIAIKLNLVDVVINKFADQQTLFYGLFICVQIVVWLSVLDAVVVSMAFQYNTFLLLPARALRLVVQIVITALYISILQVLLIPLRCATLAEYMPNACARPEATAIMSVAAVTLAAFLPLALAASVFSTEDSSKSLLLSGRNALADTVGRSVLVAVTMWRQDLHPVLTSLVFLVVESFMMWRIIKTLPFDDGWANDLRAGTYSVVAWLALVSAVLSFLKASASPLTVTITCAVMLCFLPFAPAGAVCVSRWRQRRLRGAMLDIVAKYAELDGKTTPTSTSERGHIDSAAYSPGVRFAGGTDGAALVRSPMRPAPAVARPDGPNDAAGRASADALENTGPLSSTPVAQGPRVLTAGITPSSTADAGAELRGTLSPGWRSRKQARAHHDRDSRFVYAGKETNAEAAHAARLFFHDPDNVRVLAQLALREMSDPDITPAEHQRHINDDMYDKDNVANAEAVYSLALVAFPGNVAVRIEYARFLSVFRKDDSRALGVLGLAIPSAVDQRFHIFSYRRALEQQRQSNDLGSAHATDMIGVLAFRQTYTQALAAHGTALRGLLKFWKLVLSAQEDAAKSGDGTDSSSAVVNRITHSVAQLVSARQKATSAYEGLLTKYPSAVVLLRTYANFLRDVVNDPAAADVYMQRAAQAEADALADTGAERPGIADVGHESVAKGSHVSDGNSSGNRGNALLRGRQRGGLEIKNDGVTAVNTMTKRVQWSLMTLAAVVIASFVAVRILDEDIMSELHLMDVVPSMAKEALSATFWTRSLSLAAGDPRPVPFATATENILHRCTHAKEHLRELYEPGNMFPAILSVFDDQTIPYRQFVPGYPPTIRNTFTGLFDLSNGIFTSALLLTQQSREQLNPAAAALNEHFQNVMLNVQQLYINWIAASHLYAEHIHEIADDFQAILIALLTLVFVVAGITWFGVFLPSVYRVAAAHAGVDSVVKAIPNPAVRSLASRYAKLLNQLDALADEVEAAADGDSEDDIEDDELPDEDESDKHEDTASVDSTMRAQTVSDDDRPSPPAQSPRIQSSAGKPFTRTPSRMTNTARRRSEPEDALARILGLVAAEASGDVSAAQTPARRSRLHDPMRGEGGLVDKAPQREVKLVHVPDSAPPRGEHAPTSIVKTPRASRIAWHTDTAMPGDSEPRADPQHNEHVRQRPTRAGRAHGIPSCNDSPHPQTPHEDGTTPAQRHLRGQSLSSPHSSANIHAATAAAATESVHAPSRPYGVLSAIGFSIVAVLGLRRRVHSSVAPSPGATAVSTAVDPPPRAQRYFSPLLRMLMLRVAVAMLVAVGLQCANFVVNEQQVENASLKARFIQLTGTRRARAGLCSIYARELLINDAAIAPTPQLVTWLAEAKSLMLTDHRALLIGDGRPATRSAGMYVAQDDLVFGNADETSYAQYRNANVSTVAKMAQAAAASGLSAHLMYYATLIDSILNRFVPWFMEPTTNSTPFNATQAGIVGPVLPRLEDDPVLAYIVLVDRAEGLLSQQLEGSAQLFFDEMTASSKATLNIQITVFVVNIVVLALLQMMVFRKLFRGLHEEATRAEEILALIPTATVESTPALRAFYNVESV